jgi:hypothetical protein
MLLQMFARALCVFLLWPFCLAAQGETPDRLLPFWQSDRWFELRDLVRGSVPQPPFYRAAVLCAFNDTKGCEHDVRSYLRTKDADGFPAAHNFLVFLYMRFGRFHEALMHREEVLRLEGKPAQSDGLRTMLAAFSAFPDFAVDSRRPSTVRGEFRRGQLFIPVSVGQATGNYILDTGANFSALSESEARRLGLRIRDLNVDPTQIGEGSGKGVAQPKFAVAEALSIGDIHLRHVPFLVVSDQPAAFADLPSGYRGAIGIQVLLACRTIHWDSRGTVHLDGHQARQRKSLNPNLCFSGLNVFTPAAFAKSALDVQVDTGANQSYLFQRFAEQYPDIIRASGTPGSTWLGGAGGEAEVQSTILPDVSLGLGGLTTTLQPAHVLTRNPASHGTMGMDLLNQAQEVLFDFQAMRFTLSKE